MALEDTSVQAYHDLGEKEQTQREKIFSALEKGPMSQRAVAKITGINYKSVTSRMADMRSEGLIRPAYTDVQEGSEVIVWELGAPGPSDRRFALYFTPRQWGIIVDALSRDTNVSAIIIAAKIRDKIRKQEGAT